MDQVVLYALLLTLKSSKPVSVPLPLLNELQMVTRCSLKNVASYSPVRLTYEKKNESKQFTDSAPYSRERLMVRKTR